MDLFAGVTGETRVVDLEAEVMEVLGDEVGGGLLLVEAKGEGLDSAKEEERVEGGEAVADGVDGEGDALFRGGQVSTETIQRDWTTHLGYVLAVAADDSSHEVVMSRQVLRSTVVNDVRTVLEWALEVRAHHGVVHDDDGLGLVLLDHRRDGGNVGNLEQRVGGRFEEDHGDPLLGVIEDGEEVRRLGGVEVVNFDAVVGLEVGEKTVGAAVEVVAGDDGISGLEKTEDDIEGSHARGDGKGMASRGDLSDVVLCEEDKEAIARLVGLRKEFGYAVRYAAGPPLTVYTTDHPCYRHHLRQQR